jgi:3-oxoadipate enol-lactonase
MDARGWGDSDDYAGPLTLADMSADIARVMDHFGHEKAHLVGLSMGGCNAMHFATTCPQRVRSLTLCDTLIGFSVWSAQKKSEFLRARRDPLLSGTEPAEIAWPIARSLVSPRASEQAIAQLADSLGRLHKSMYIKALEMLMREPDQDLGAISAPTLVVVGEDDPITPVAQSRQIADGIRAARLTVVSAAGHLVNIERPVEFNDLLLQFLIGLSQA